MLALARTSGTVTVTDTLPSGLTATAFAGTGWTCTASRRSRARAASAIAASASAPPLTLTVNVATNAPASVTNTATVSGGGDDQHRQQHRHDPTTIVGEPDLTIDEDAHGQLHAGPDRDLHDHRDQRRQRRDERHHHGHRHAAGRPHGDGVRRHRLDLHLSPLSCTRSDSLGAGASSSAADADGERRGQRARERHQYGHGLGRRRHNTANNTRRDPTTIAGEPDLTIAKTHAGNFTQGQTGATYTMTVTNAGTAPTTGAITVTDTLPAASRPRRSPARAGPAPSPPLSCTRSDVLAAGASYPAITLTVNVAANAPASVTNTATVSGGGETTPANNTATDPTTIVARARSDDHEDAHGQLHAGPDGRHLHADRHQRRRAATSGAVTVTDTLPAGLTATALAGTGWTCTLPPALLHAQRRARRRRELSPDHADRECRGQRAGKRDQHGDGLRRRRDATPRNNTATRSDDDRRGTRSDDHQDAHGQLHAGADGRDLHDHRHQLWRSGRRPAPSP